MNVLPVVARAYPCLAHGFGEVGAPIALFEAEPVALHAKDNMCLCPSGINR